MTTQYIIVGIIIASAAAIIAFRLIKSIRKPAGKCDGCALASNACAIHEMKTQNCEPKNLTY
jgi:hypothetical protein